MASRFSEAPASLLRKKTATSAPFNISGRRSPVAESAHVAGAHSYASSKQTAVPIERYFYPPFLSTGRRSPLVARDAADSPGPASATVSSPFRRVASAPRRVAPPAAAWHAPSIPFVTPPLTSPDPASYSPLLGRTRGGDAAVSFSRDKSQRTPVYAPTASPGPGAFSAAPIRSTGGAFIATVASAAFGPRSRPSTRSPDTDALARAPTPGPGAHLSLYAESGFLRAAESRSASLSRSTRDVFGARGEHSHERPESAARALPAEPRPQTSPSLLGGTEARFRLPPGERQGRENPPPGTYNIARPFGATVAPERVQPMHFPTAPRSSPLVSSALRRGAADNFLVVDEKGGGGGGSSGGGSSGGGSRGGGGRGGGSGVTGVEQPIRGTTRTHTVPAPPQLLLDAANAASASASVNGIWSPLATTFNVAGQEGVLLGKTSGRRETPVADVPGPGAYDVSRQISLSWVGANSVQAGFGTGRRSPIVPLHAAHEAAFTNELRGSVLVPTFNARFRESIAARLSGMSA